MQQEATQQRRQSRWVWRRGRTPSCVLVVCCWTWWWRSRDNRAGGCLRLVACLVACLLCLLALLQVQQRRQCSRDTGAGDIDRGVQRLALCRKEHVSSMPTGCMWAASMGLRHLQHTIRPLTCLCFIALSSYCCRCMKCLRCCCTLSHSVGLVYSSTVGVEHSFDARSAHVVVKNSVRLFLEAGLQRNR
jgi:hypothetical protein